MFAPLLSWRWKKLFKVWCAYQAVIHMPKTYHLWPTVLSMNSYNVLEQKRLRMKKLWFLKCNIYLLLRGDTIWSSPAGHIRLCFQSSNNQKDQKLLEVCDFLACVACGISRACFVSAEVARELARAAAKPRGRLRRFSWRLRRWNKTHARNPASYAGWWVFLQFSLKLFMALFALRLRNCC